MKIRKYKINRTVRRIKRMERLFDEVDKVLKNRPEKLNSADTTKKVRTLSDYYSCGDWLCDYELDKQRLLPPDLKRGVLSQDGLYNLLCSINEAKKR